MIGTFQHTIDTKGRMFVPSRMRDELGNKFYVTISIDQCLQIYTEEMWDEAIEKIRTMPQEAQMQLRPLFACANECELDKQGRIQLSQDLRDLVGLKKNVTIVGTGLYVQIWDADTYKPVEESERQTENVRDAIRKFSF